MTGGGLWVSLLTDFQPDHCRAVSCSWYISSFGCSSLSNSLVVLGHRSENENCGRFVNQILNKNSQLTYTHGISLGYKAKYLL